MTHLRGMVCQGPAGDAMRTGGSFGDGFYETGDPPLTAASLLLPSPRYPAQLEADPRAACPPAPAMEAQGKGKSLVLHRNGPRCPGSKEDETATSWAAWEPCPAPSLAVPASLCYSRT